MKQNLNLPKITKILILLFLFSLRPIAAHSVENITLNVGESFTYDPLDFYPQVNGSYCQLSDSIALLCSYEVRYYTDTHLNDYFTNKYTIIAQKKGVYHVKFCDLVRDKMKIDDFGYKEFTHLKYNDYNITVLDVVSISIPDEIEISEGGKYKYSPIITDAEASTTLTWHSSNPGVVSVEDGEIQGNSVGTAILSCIAHNGVMAQSKVTVTPIAAEEIVLEQSEVEIPLFTSVKIGATVLPENATNKKLKWTSMKPDIAVVGSDGTVTGLTEGYAMIYAMSSDGSNIVSKSLVHVVPQQIPIQAIVSDHSSYAIEPGESVTINTTVLPGNANNRSLLWSSSDSEIATVDEYGNVTGLMNGKVTIVAMSVDGSEVSGSCEVIVSDKGQSEQTYGDINGDGAVTVGDITSIIEVMIGE